MTTPLASRIAAKFLQESTPSLAERVAAKHLEARGDVVSQVGEILHGRGTSDEAYDKEIVDYCDETRKTLKKLEAIFDGAFHDIVDFKENIPAAKNPKVRQLAQEQLSEMINQAATRVELLSYTLRNEIETLLANLEAGAKDD